MVPEALRTIREPYAGPYADYMSPGRLVGPEPAISFGRYLFYPFLLEVNLKLSKSAFEKLKLPSSGFSLIDVPMNEAL